MILTLDIGNTNIKTALFDGKDMVQYWRLSTNITNTSDEYGINIISLFRHAGVDPKAVEGIVMSSVVPTINFTIEHMCQNYFGLTPMVIGPGVRTGINIRYENPRELGSDRIANAVAAYELYGGPCITIDFGTATSRNRPTRIARLQARTRGIDTQDNNRLGTDVCHRKSTTIFAPLTWHNAKIILRLIEHHRRCLGVLRKERSRG